MATEYRLPYSASEISEKLGKVDNTILITPQTLDDSQKTQARENIDAISLQDVEEYLHANDDIEFSESGNPVELNVKPETPL